MKCDIKINCGLNDNSDIQFANQEYIIIDSNIVHIQPHLPKIKLLSVFECHLEFRGKEGITSEGGHGDH